MIVCVAPGTDAVPLEYDVKPPLVGALDVSAIEGWIALTWHGKLSDGEQLIVFGAGRVVGQNAVQSPLPARRGRVIAAAAPTPRRRSRRLGADTVVRLDAEDLEILAERFRDASEDSSTGPAFRPPRRCAPLTPHGRASFITELCPRHL